MCATDSWPPPSAVWAEPCRADLPLIPMRARARSVASRGRRDAGDGRAEIGWFVARDPVHRRSVEVRSP
ncbi:hypothetical protein SHJG_8001 [Streptomyces hygroscopicus subsp. jinggangensis 5008]|nr:hypothetical protein SHJG_8001 [Streptomyces hygroscopicus subsp. jinggangensis 5008]AGF67425.1 hypothetical protein SHJGH_7763 [Streptomyces hygroscopicus subsp. jinggangensis TL01]